MGWEKGEFIVEFDVCSDEMVINERIVRCKDCIHLNMGCDLLEFCFNGMEEMGFCAWGQRALEEKNDG